MNNIWDGLLVLGKHVAFLKAWSASNDVFDRES